MIMLVVGLVLIIVVGYFGQRSERDTEGGDLVAPDNQTGHEAALSIRDVSQRYGPQWALARVSLDVPAGRRLSILGPNGAGKSTLLHILATLNLPTAGDVLVGETSLMTNPAALRHQVGLVAHKPLLYPHLTVLENLSFFGRLYDLPNWSARAEMLLKQVRLWSKRHAQVQSLSQGQKQRVAIVRALLHDPDIVLMDEPYAGLDLRAAEQLDALLDTLTAQGHTLVFTTHDLQRSYDQADQVVILADGRIVYEAQTHLIDFGALRDKYDKILTHFSEDHDD
jgi:ABC-type multidrug transport system ATPase subunit